MIGDSQLKQFTPSERSQLTETKKRQQANFNEASPDYVGVHEGQNPSKTPMNINNEESDDDDEEGYSADDNSDTEEAKESKESKPVLPCVSR